MTLTISRREQERPLHPNARIALEHVLMANDYDPDDALIIADDIDTSSWVMLPGGRRELRDMADDIGLFAFLTFDMEG
jgi:predicted LPLAT superfamily acyltransferase